MARLKTKWNQKDRQRTPEEIASVIGFNLWVLAGEACLFLENEGFETRSHFAGNYVQAVMGEKDNKWIPDYVIDSEIPKLLLALKRVFKGQHSSLSEADFAPPPIPESGVWGEE